MTPIGVGVAGLGRTGWRNHVGAVRALPDLYRLAAVADPDPARRREAGCRAYPDLPGLLADPAVELVVLATPSHLHADQAVAALRAGRAVLCEKPMAADLAGADRMIAAAAAADRPLAVFHNRRYEPDFLRIRELLAAGTLGRLLSARLCMHRFARRYDWQARDRYAGGALRNSGWHLLDLALELLGPDPVPVAATMARALSPGDAEDYVKVVLAAGGMLADVEVSDVSPYPQAEWLLVGTAGSLTGSPARLDWRYVRPAELPPLRVQDGPPPGRGYDADRPTPVEGSWQRPAGGAGSAERYYRALHAGLRDGTGPPVPLARSRQVQAVIEECFRRAGR